MRRSTCLGLFVAGAGFAALAAFSHTNDPVDPLPGPDEPPVSFNRDIRPILSNNCFKCHGPDSATREVGLRLDTRQGAMSPTEDGIVAIVPGDLETSELIARVTSDDESYRMPPEESNKELTEEEIQLLREWVEQGAAWEDHWAFNAPIKHTPPQLGRTDWPKNAIDAFVLARLDSEGLEPSPEADRATSIRRLSFDLTGLPPTLDEIDDFENDTSPDAYEKLVDRLLASSHYGERMANEWLDAARYADTNGYHHDDFRTMWPWRDWVIDAYNDNKPFDEFTIEQLAGDLLEDPTRDQIIATGFNRNHGISDEGGALDAEYLVEYAADRVATTSTVFLGLTMECARCHDHKFDPISQEEYYGLFAFFNSIDERGVPPRQPNRSFAYGPSISAPTPEQEQSLLELTEKVDALRAERDAPDSSEAEAQANWEQGVRSTYGVDWSLPAPTSMVSQAGSDMTLLEDGSFEVTGKEPDKDVHTITLTTGRTNLRLLRLDVLALAEKGSAGRTSHGNAVLSGIELDVRSLADPELRETVTFAEGWASHEQPNGDFDIHNIIGEKSGEGWAINGHNVSGDRVAIFIADQPFGYVGGSELTVRLRYESRYTKHVIGRARIGVSPSGASITDVLPLIARDWFRAGPFPAETGNEAFETAFGPESSSYISPDLVIEGTNLRWRHAPNVTDGQTFALQGQKRAFYFGRTMFTPVARTLDASLGSDDALRVFLNGEEVLSNNVRRGVAADQESVQLNLKPGENTIIVKIVNDGGPGGFYYNGLDTLPDAPMPVEPLALIDPAVRSENLSEKLAFEYRFNESPVYRALSEQIEAASTERAAIEAAVPVTMVMGERDGPRPTYLLTRGAYDNPDMERPIDRGTPEAIGSWPEDAPRNRLGLAQWIVSPDNPLTTRVTVNRFWQTIFGTGLVRTSENFGSQAQWPSHPELLDYLAVDFQESGWDVKRLVKTFVMSATYRQSSHLTEEMLERDPENALLARGPRQRLSAEMLRDQALAISGLLVRTVGGAPVKPYQPDGLWAERAIPSSNTKTFRRDSGEKLYRRSMYTFWKRSAPPPQMAIFDAPEREFCVVRRSSTNTPIQALVLMNDETYLEISRMLALRSMLEAAANPEARIEMMFRLATGRRPDPQESQLLADTLGGHLTRYEQSPDDAADLLSYGESMVPAGISQPELAAYTLLASGILNLHETLTKD